MKSKLYLLLLAPMLIFASCKKYMLDGSSNNIVGTWQLQYAERIRSYGAEPITTGYEYGEFYFSNNGSARYSDDIGTLNGSWRMVPRSDGYQNSSQFSLEMRLYDNYSGDAIEWEFYAVEVSGSRMTGYMNRYGNEYRYEFRRY